MKIEWVETSREVYAAIFAQHIEGSHLFESFTNVDEWSTTWGLNGAGAPLVKAKRVDGKITFFLARVKEED